MKKAKRSYRRKAKKTYKAKAKKVDRSIANARRFATFLKDLEEKESNSE